MVDKNLNCLYREQEIVTYDDIRETAVKKILMLRRF